MADHTREIGQELLVSIIECYEAEVQVKKVARKEPAEITEEAV
ncbi:hypothetical protein MKZ26_05105 [Sporosarcina sp. FSL K6-6792]